MLAPQGRGDKIASWNKIPYSAVPKLEQYGEPGDEWLKMRDQVQKAYCKYLPGGSFAFAKDAEGNLWFIQWDPFGDDCLYLKVGPG